MSNQSLDLFFQACEVAGPRELSVGAGSGRHVLPYPFGVVGSDPRCDLVLDVEAVRPRHCYLQAIGPKVLCVDLNLDADLRPAQACWLDGTRAVRVGGQWIGPVGNRGWSDAPRGGAEFLPLLSQPLPRIALEFQVNSIKSRWRMRRAFALVGSDPACTVRLNEPGVSRYHCALVLTGLGLWVVDLLGRVESPGKSLVVVNGARARYARLEPGDVLEIGRFRVNVVYLEASNPTLLASVDGWDIPELQSSGEIDLKGRDRAGPAVGATDVEGVRRECEERLDEEAERHRAEVESLLNEIETLREQLSEARHSAFPVSLRGRLGEVSRIPFSTDDPATLEAAGRTLGTASRRVRPTFSALPIVLPDGETRPVTGESDDVRANVGGPAALWHTFDGGLIATNQASPQLR